MVARQLIGSVLIHDAPEGMAAGLIVETEAYRGPEDLAAHSAGGRRTKRTEAMWGAPGHAYMFMLYGMHWAFNVVAGRVGEPHAVLVRAVEPLAPMDLVCLRRGMGPRRRELSNGPGKLCAALGLNREHYEVDLCADDAAVRIVKGRGQLTQRSIGRSPRINVDYAGTWVDKPWRFYLRGNRYVSVKPRD